MLSILTIWAAEVKVPNVCFGSKADMCAAISHVRFTPNSERESGHGPVPHMQHCPLKNETVLRSREFGGCYVNWSAAVD
jgi:hypothetical protein